jgi:3-mercaptopyruvate sulfurtransferase SseA
LAKNVPRAQVVNDDGTFKTLELHKIYDEQEITQDKDIITYCRIDERSSHTWFVLKYLLGYLNVQNMMDHGQNRAILLETLLKNDMVMNKLKKLIL